MTKDHAKWKKIAGAYPNIIEQPMTYLNLEGIPTTIQTTPPRVYGSVIHESTQNLFSKSIRREKKVVYIIKYRLIITKHEYNPVATIAAQHINLGKIANSKAMEIIITNLSLLILPD